MTMRMVGAEFAIPLRNRNIEQLHHYMKTGNKVSAPVPMVHIVHHWWCTFTTAGSWIVERLLPLLYRTIVDTSLFSP